MRDKHLRFSLGPMHTQCNEFYANLKSTKVKWYNFTFTLTWNAVFHFKSDTAYTCKASHKGISPRQANKTNLEMEMKV